MPHGQRRWEIGFAQHLSKFDLDKATDLEIGTSFAAPSKGFSVLSPTWSRDTYIQDTSALKGIASHAIWPARSPDTPAFSRSNSLMTQNGSKAAKHQMKIVLIFAYVSGMESS